MSIFLFLLSAMILVSEVGHLSLEGRAVISPYTIPHLSRNIMRTALLWRHITMRTALLWRHITMRTALLWRHITMRTALPWRHITRWTALLWRHTTMRTALLWRYITKRAAPIWRHLTMRTVLLWRHITMTTLLWRHRGPDDGVLTFNCCTCVLNSSIVELETVMSLNMPSSLLVNWQPHSV